MKYILVTVGQAMLILGTFFGSLITLYNCFGQSSPSGETYRSDYPEYELTIMIARHDTNGDYKLNKAELIGWIKNYYEKRETMIRNRREMLIARGILSPIWNDHGVITLSYLPADWAEIILNKSDTNKDGSLDRDEILDSKYVRRELQNLTRVIR